MKNISILGSSGSIGTQALEVIRHLGNVNVRALTVNTSVDLLESQAREFRPALVGASDPESAVILKERLFGTGIRVYGGDEAMYAAAGEESSEMLLTAVVGNCGLGPTFAAIDAGKDIALANKETLVSAGKLFFEKVHEKGVKVLPVDSEHSAIFQCLQGRGPNGIKKILLTCSGGAFRGKKYEELLTMTAADALKHPTWNMGSKITIDSATLMNKGLEVVEAKWLFDVELDQIEVVVHPQSVIHSAVEYEDNSVIAQMAVPDMKGAIQYAFTYPERKPSPMKELDLFSYGSLTFEKPDTEAFRCLSLAYRAAAMGGNAMCIVNGANESAVARFLKGEIGFTDIARIIEKTLDASEIIQDYTLGDLLRSDLEAKAYAKELQL